MSIADLLDSSSLAVFVDIEPQRRVEDFDERFEVFFENAEVSVRTC